ncbi:MAG: APC family permease [Anaerolineae bacterium]|nr:APC family permease [Anaerolineae bacterium]
MTLGSIRRTLLGLPLPSARMAHERLSKVQALAVLSSDALSSVAYATEEILLVLVLAGGGALGLSWPIAMAIGMLLLIVAISYYQTVHAYPTGGGAYTVSKENLGTLPSLVAGAALLTDYVLTVAVSISAGVAAITSAFESLEPLRVEIALVAIAIITLVNLRGLRESGRVFAVPTYFFVGTMYLLIGLGLARWLLGGLVSLPAPTFTETAVTHNLTLFLILRAFASGCTAMTGVEAISNGVTVFKSPEADNAGKTLLWMAGILISMFLGITFLVHQLGLTPNENETIISQLGRSVFGEGPLYYALQVATALILLLAANTSYSDFPRLAMWMARDRFLPRQLANLGDRLVYANGILVLGLVAGLLVIVFGAETHALIPLYAVGVFVSFTLNQAGMVRHWLKLRTPGWWRSALINGAGAAATAIVLVVVAATKFTHGAWFILLLIPTLVVIFRTIHRHYVEIAQQLDLSGRWPTPIKRHTIIVPVADLHRGVLKAIYYAQSLGGQLHVVTVEVEPEATATLNTRWQKNLPNIPLEILPSPYRSVTEPLLAYIDKHIRSEGDYVTVLVPEFVPAHWWQHLLHNETAWALKLALLYNRRDWRGRFRLISNVPFYLSR